MTWAAYDGELLRVRQGKTRAQLVIPVSAALKAELDATPRNGLYVVSHEGRPFTSDGVRSSWAKAAERAGIEGLTFHISAARSRPRLTSAAQPTPKSPPSPGTGPTGRRTRPFAAITYS